MMTAADVLNRRTCSSARSIGTMKQTKKKSPG